MNRRGPDQRVSRREGAHPVEGCAPLVQLDEDERFLAKELARFVSAGIASDDVVIVIVTEPHREALEERLGRHELDPADLSDTRRRRRHRRGSRSTVAKAASGSD